MATSVANRLEQQTKVRPRAVRSGTFTETARSTFYRKARTPLRTEDLIEIENAGRRCGVCHSGRGWRRFELVRPSDREPVVLCGSCRARFGDDPPVGGNPVSAVEPVPPTAEPLAPPHQRSGERGTDQRPDRLRAALRKLPELVLDGDGRPGGRSYPREGACPATGPRAPRRGPARRQAVVDSATPERRRRRHGSASGAYEQHSDRPGTGADRLTSRRRAIAGGSDRLGSDRRWPANARRVFPVTGALWRARPSAQRGHHRFSRPPPAGGATVRAARRDRSVGARGGCGR